MLYHEEEQDLIADPHCDRHALDYRCSAASIAENWIGEMLQNNKARATHAFERAVTAQVIEPQGMWQHFNAWMSSPKEEEKAKLLAQLTMPDPEVVWKASPSEWTAEAPPSRWLCTQWEASLDALPKGEGLFLVAKMLEYTCGDDPWHTSVALEGLCIRAQEFPKLLSALQNLPVKDLGCLCGSGDLLKTWQRYIDPNPIKDAPASLLPCIARSGDNAVLQAALQQNPGPYEKGHALYDLPAQLCQRWPVSTLLQALQVLDQHGLDSEPAEKAFAQNLKKRGAWPILEARRQARELEALKTAVSKPAEKGKLRM